MNIYKLELILKKEFSFLKKILKKDESDRAMNVAELQTEEGFIINPDYIKVKRVDENLLSMTPSVSWYNNNDSEVDWYAAITAKEDGYEIIYLNCWDSEDKQEVRSIGEQLFARKLNPDFIVHLNIKEEYYNKWIKVVIYKMKNFDLAEYHCQQIDKATRELKAEIHTVCAGGE